MSMAEVYVDDDEWYPVYSLREVAEYMRKGRWSDGIVTITDELRAEYDRVMSEFDDMQNKIKALPCQQHGHRPPDRWGMCYQCSTKIA